MFAGTIERRVMKVFKDKIRNAQVEYDSGVKAIEQEAEEKKLKLEDKVVDSLIGKLI